ncbi:hypothetical protein [Ruminococcus difficilis]|uniref:Antitoxin VbhA domain-containing protein n=1 Tax=Ruminococcus difficilis TaxID=2763069 RepID=A0A934WPM7_9FIRM|nr:hypothetical protein [Ruminococcus difficilis]MBK6088431.1 hypothetical protein [Ruminococcus difficilis]MEE1356000.1 hypothetical protein [Clostridia bacterium]SCX27019.1 hypothetical protein SAMN02910436_02192 [Ruminococcaceae bacterium P7]
MKNEEKRLGAVKIAKAINSIEGVPTPDETNEIICQWIDGKISDDQLTDVLLSLCKRIIYEQNEELQSNSA